MTTPANREIAAKMISKKKIWLFLCLMFLLAGCGSAPGAPKTAGGPPGEPPPNSPSAVASAGPQQYPAQPGFSGDPSGGFSMDAPAKAEPGGGGGGRSQPSPPPPAPASRADSSKSGGGSATTSTPPRSTEEAGKKSAANKEPSPDSRPGLGTEWGETRTSRVHDVTFVRDSGRPFALATMHYNDKKGVDALAAVHAQRETRRDVSTGGGAISVSIRDASGNALEALHVGDRTMVVGQAGQRYSIVLTNHTKHRFESVVTVDGLDVVNGKTGSMENRGYVLLPFATLEIEGFRQSAAAVAAFRFAAVGESYAAAVGQARNVGVIGVAFFSERGDSFVDQQDLRMRDSATPFPADPRFAPPPPRR
jgi:hypothetical protein